MTKNSYRRDITTANTPQAAYKALTTGFDKWWTPGSAPAKTEGDVVTFRFEPTYWTMRATRLIPDELVEFECIEAFHKYDGSPDSILKEWEGTKLRWKIQKQGDETKISFVHEGLIPSLNCFDICESGWNHFFVNELQRYLDNS